MYPGRYVPQSRRSDGSRVDVLYPPAWKLVSLDAPVPISWKSVSHYSVRIERSDWTPDQTIFLWSAEEFLDIGVVFFNMHVPDQNPEIIGFDDRCIDSEMIMSMWADKKIESIAPGEECTLDLFRRPRHNDEI